MSKVKLIADLFKEIKKYKTAKDLIENINIDIDKKEDDEKNIKTTQGYIYERLWDICIKFGLVKNIITFDNTKNKLLHINDNINLAYYLNIEIFKEFKDIFDKYLKTNIQSGKGGGYSDISFRNNDSIIISSSKYFENDDKQDIKNYDISQLCIFLETNQDKNIKIILFINNKEKFIKKRQTDNKSSLILSKYINPNGNYENVFDINDLEKYFIELKKILNYYNYFKSTNDIKNFKQIYLNKFQQVFIPKFHQSLYINQIINIIKTKEKKENKNILIGAIPRTGKTYIIGGIIRKYIEIEKKDNYNFLIITPAPTETIPQYNELFNTYLDFNDIEVIDKTVIKETEKNKEISNKKIYIFSKQVLDTQERKEKETIEEDKSIITILTKINFDFIFIDEAHFGMTTQKSDELLEKLISSDTWKILITATYNKPIIKFNIPIKNKLIWSLENVISLKRIANFDNSFDVITNIKKFYNNYIGNINKNFNKKIIDGVLLNDYGISSNFNNYDINELYTKLKIILNQYKDFPEPYLITTVWKNIDEIYNEIRLANGLDRYTFSLDELFDLNKDNSFTNEQELIELFHYFYGYPRKKIILKDDKNEQVINNVSYNLRYEYKQYGIIPRINNICKNNCRTLQDTTTQLWFLPTNNNKLSNKIPVLLELLDIHFNYYFKQTLFLVAISEVIKNKYKKDNILYDIKNKNDIFNAEINYKHKYKNIVILTGKKFNLGISLPSVDIVVLFNTSESNDLLYQMMFRSMTEVPNNDKCIPNNYCSKKKYGFIVDLNPQRTIVLTNYIKNYIIKTPNSNNEEIENKRKTLDLLNIDRDFYKSSFDDDKEDTIELQKEFTESFFKKLALVSNEDSKSILNKLMNLNISFDNKFINSIKDIIKNFEFNDNDIKKIIIHKIGVDFEEKLKKEVKKEKPEINEEDIKKEINDISKIYGILSEVIPIISIITDMNYKCVFKENNLGIYTENLITNLNIINDNEELHEIFIEFVEDRCNLKLESKQDFKYYYNFFIQLIMKLNSKHTPKNKLRSSSPKDIPKDKLRSSSPKDIPKDKLRSSSSKDKHKDKLKDIPKSLSRKDIPNDISRSLSRKDIFKDKLKSLSPKDIPKDKLKDKFKDIPKSLSRKDIPNDISRSLSRKINKISDNDCNKWKKNKLINPLTGRVIKEGKKLYNKLEKNCAHINTPIIKGGNEIKETIESIVGEIKEKLHNINDPKSLLEFINKHLKPTERKKKENGEVFTPIPLIEEMMDKLEESNPLIFTNENLKWLDPAAGMGNFSVVVYLKLMKGLASQIKNPEERREWILTKMLYMVEYDKTNVFMMKRIFCGNKYKLNIFHGSFIDGDRYINEGIDILNLDSKEIKKDDNKKFIEKINKFDGKFDVIMGNPPFNSGGINSKKKDINKQENKRETVWPNFVEKSFKLLKENTGYLLFIHPLSWLKKTDKDIHNLLLEKEIIWLLLWDYATSLKQFNLTSGKIPISIYLLKNKLNKNKLKTNINCHYNDIKFKINSINYLDNNLSIPLGFFSSLLKLQLFIKKNNLYLNYKTNKIKKDNLLFKYNNKSKKQNLPKTYKLEDNYCIDTYTIKDGIKINKSKEIHIDAEKSKLIIAHKSSLNGIFIDDGRLGLCGSHQYYIIGDIKYLNFIKKILSFKLILIASLFTKFGQNFLDTDVFLYIPDLTKLGYKDISESKFYELLKLTKEEIKEIKDFNIKTYD